MERTTRRRLQSELHEIERELDKTTAEENSPYRYARQKLNRRKEAILRALKGDPRFEATGELQRVGGLTSPEQKVYRMKRALQQLKEELE
jgi:hypothetical protein